MTPAIETARLLLHRLELADADQAQILFPHWAIVRYLTKQVLFLRDEHPAAAAKMKPQMNAD